MIANAQNSKTVLHRHHHVIENVQDNMLEVEVEAGEHLPHRKGCESMTCLQLTTCKPVVYDVWHEDADDEDIGFFSSYRLK